MCVTSAHGLDHPRPGAISTRPPGLEEEHVLRPFWADAAHPSGMTANKG